MIDTIVEIRDGDVVPALAESVEVSPDQKKWTYRLKKNVKWSDGVPFEAKHVVDSWIRQLKPYFQGRYDSLLLEVENANEYKSGKLTNVAKVGIHAVDAHTVEVRLKRPIPFWKYIPTLWAMAPVRIDLLEKHGLAWTDPGKMAVLGPYQLESIDVGKKIRVVPNPNYWRGRGKLSAIEFVILADEAEAKNRFYEKSSAPAALDLLIDVAGVDSGRPKVGSVLSSLNERTAFMTVGHKKEMLRDPAFRRSLAQSLDVSALADRLGIGVRPAFTRRDFADSRF
jgi:oligopeptide transport system substrate-binding protein